MSFKAYLQVFCCLFCSLIAYPQHADSSRKFVPDSNVLMHPALKPNISFVSYLQLLKGNFIRQSLAPFRAGKSDLFALGGFALATGGVMRYDRTINQQFLKFHNNSSALRKASPLVTKFGGRYALFTMAGIGSWSYLFKNQQLTNATLLATQSYLTSGIWVGAIKFISGRERPSYVNPQTHDSRGSWHGMFFQFKKTTAGIKPDGAQYSSFPSGHAAAAFSIATVYAEMYRNQRWVPLLAYTSASLIGLSRIMENRHWASDVLVSSALGYLCGKQVVRNFYMLQRLSSFSCRKQYKLTYNLNFVHNTIMPELICTFK